MERRRFLASGGAIVTSLAAGCGETQSSQGSPPEETTAKKLEVVTPESTPTPSPSPSPSPTSSRIECPESVPAHEVYDIEDISYGNVVRIEIDIRLYRPGDDYTDEEFQRLNQEAVCRTTNEVPVNAIAVFYWEPGQTPGYESAYATNDWAPYGEWSRADAVETGDYSHHEHDFERL